MANGLPDNPRASVPREVQTNPALYPVAATKRPDNIADLLSHKEVIYSNWEYDVGGRQLYYLDGIVSFMRMFGVQKIIFLKEDDYIKNAIKTVEKDTAWTSQANFAWSEDVAANQLRRINKRQAVGFTKIVHTIVACEHFLRKKNICSPYWVYDYMRIVPAVYNIDKLHTDSVDKLATKVGARANLEAAAGPNFLDVLYDLANGYCVTAPTAYELTKFINLYPELGIGAVRFKPGKKRLGRNHASSNEEVEIR